MSNLFKYIILFVLSQYLTHAHAQSPTQLLTECQSLNSQTISRNVKKLQRFNLSEFDNVAKQKLASLLQANPPHQDQLIKLAGFLEMQTELQNILSQETISKKNKEALKLALVRIGDEVKLQNLMKNIKKIPIGDDFIYQIVPVLIYVRQKAATDYLMEIILQDSEDCTPADAETSGTVNCAYRIIEALAPVVIDFPVEVDDFGDIVTKDYEASLKKVRKWIRKNKASYELNKEIY